MGREIEFRAKAVNRVPGQEYRTSYKNGDWVFGLLTKRKFTCNLGELPAEMTNTDGVTGIEVDDVTIGEYTGLKDKGGRKIYEGDIVLVNGKYIRYVAYSGVFTAFVLMKYYDEQTSEVGMILGSGYENYKQSVEVVGNVYDNPELRKREVWQ